MEKQKMYQTIILTLSDGRVISFTGEAQIVEEDIMNGIKVRDVKITPPRPVPEGLEFVHIARLEKPKLLGADGFPVDPRTLNNRYGSVTKQN